MLLSFRLSCDRQQARDRAELAGIHAQQCVTRAGHVVPRACAGGRVVRSQRRGGLTARRMPRRKNASGARYRERQRNAVKNIVHGLVGVGPLPTAGFAIWLTCTCSLRQVLSMSPFAPKLCSGHSSGAIRMRFPKNWCLHQRIGIDLLGFLPRSAVSKSDTVMRLIRCSVSRPL